jgi:tetratricopeptide (TPR) repeat protein
MATPTEGRSTPPIKGSWEELLMRAQQMAANQNDEAIEIYDKLINRLMAMPRERRMVNNQRLQNILVQSCVNAQAFLNVLERYDDSLHVMDQMVAAVDEEERDAVQVHRAEILLTAGRVEEGIDVLRQVAAANENELEDLGAIFHAYIRVHHLDEAAAVLDEMEQLVEERATDEEVESEALARDRAYLHSLRTQLALERREWQAAIDWFEQAVEADPGYRDAYYMVYMPLVRSGQFEEALPLIQQDTERKVRPTFWRALALYHLGREEEAKRLWSEVTETELDESEARNFNEVLLAFYYLGDPERMGLELGLRLLNETRNPSWAVFFLVGLGWAMRRNLRNARLNFDTSLQQRRMTAQGTEFPEEIMIFVRDLLPADVQAELANYFPEDGAQPGRAPTGAEQNGAETAETWEQENPTASGEDDAPDASPHEAGNE